MKPDAVVCATFLIFAFVTAGFVQTFWLKSQFSKRFQRPLDGGRTLRGVRIFGDNKTWRGFIAIVPGVGIAFVLFRILFAAFPYHILGGLWPLSILQFGLLGCLVGIGFMLGELPNSFMKRRLGVPPGEAPETSTARWICFLVDRFDSILGGMLVLALVVPVPFLTWCYIFLFGPFIHLGFNVLLFQLGVKARPR
jgi:CDP-2,3-bis-(O-geranylgeranyl)-sn-glycerol synthase